MGKKSNKFRKNNQGEKGNKKAKGQWKCVQIPDDHPLFKQYYQKQLKLDQEDFNKFWLAMKQKLPVVFRVNPNFANHQEFCAKLGNEDFMKSLMCTEIIQQQEIKQNTQNNKNNTVTNPSKQSQNQFELKQLPKLQLIPWYPGNIVYTMNTNKQTFKKNPILAQFHKYLQKSFDSGLISRQQLVSMLPPLYLDIQHDDIVLDLCAAPGSKTSQILQLLYGTKRWLAKGCVIANDADYSRAQMLIHQLNRSGTTGMAVVNHAGQFLPELYTTKVGSVKHKFQFDKILCDVPCSGDGATRKLPIKWLKWHTSDGMILHPLQLSILMKAVNLLKKGGLLVYSTCSLNPIENEAVVNALFDKVGRGLELVDIHDMFGVKGRRGMLKWDVSAITDKCYENEKQEGEKEIGKKFIKQYQNYESAKNFQKIKPTMFAPDLQLAKERHLQYSMRVLPHDQNSGGFYVALFKKRMDFEWKYSASQKKKIEEKGQEEAEQEFLQKNLPQLDELVAKEEGQDDEKKVEISQNEDQEENEGNVRNNENKKEEEQVMEKKQVMEENFNKWGNKIQKKPKNSKFQNYVNLSQQQFENIQKFFGLPEELRNLLYVRSSDGQNSGRKVLLVSEGIRKFLEADIDKKMKLVNMGCQVFEKGKVSFSGSQCFYKLCQDGIHFILEHMKERKIKVSLEFFKRAISAKTLTHEQIKEQSMRQQIQKMSVGSFCIYIDEFLNGHQIVDALVGQNFKNSFHLMISKEDQASFGIRYL